MTVTRIALAASLAILGCGASNDTTTSDAGGGGSDAGGGAVASDSGGGGVDAGGADSAASSDSGSTAACTGKGAPLAATAGQWTWIDFPNSTCGKGTPTGIAVNLGTSRRLFLYLEGGGGCFDYASCSGTDQNHKAANLDGYVKSNFDQDKTQFLGAGTVFDRSAASNPFKDDSFVFVPYCTGDMHAGSSVHDYGNGLQIHHGGFSNMTAFLDRITPTFCGNVDRVILAGSSAGGAGAIFNFDQVQRAFGGTRVDLVDDSFPLESPQDMPLQTQMRAAWGAAANDPPGCTACAQGWDAFLPYLANRYPNQRFALISSYQDPSICFYFGNSDPAVCKAALFRLYASRLQPLANFRAFGLDAYVHVWFQAGQYLTATSGGTPLTTWLARDVGDDAAWANVMP